MHASDFDGEFEIHNLHELLEFLRKKPTFDSNSFTLAFEDDGFPQFSVFTKNEIAVALHGCG